MSEEDTRDPNTLVTPAPDKCMYECPECNHRYDGQLVPGKPTLCPNCTEQFLAENVPALRVIR
jgi:hypothetical protein